MTVAPLAPETDGASAARRKKWALLEYLRTESVRRRQRACQSRPRGAFVAVEHGGGTSGFAGLQSCGSIACPHCGPKIAGSRTADVTAAVRLWRESGGTIGFGTLTLRHHAGQSLDALLDAVSACWKAATNGRAWRSERADYGVSGYVRVFEVTHGRHGWHVHVHFLVFLAHDSAEPLLATMFDRWARKAVALGLRAPLLRAQDLHTVVGDPEDTARSMGLYFAKQAAELGSDLAAGDIAFEVTGGPLKASGSASPGDILTAAASGDRSSALLWSEYELAITARRTIGWSRGLRDALGLDRELTDQEAAETADAVHGYPVRCEIAGPSWRRLVRSGLRLQLLEFARSHPPAAVRVWLLQRGLVCWLAEVGVPEVPVDDDSPLLRTHPGGFVRFLADELASAP